MILSIIIGVILVVGVVAGIVIDVKNATNLGRTVGVEPRKVGNNSDGAFIDGMVTSAALIELDEMFK